MTNSQINWITVCNLADITPGTGVCALVNNEHVAVFRPFATNEIFAISNIDPFAYASVLSRGIIGKNDVDLYVASPLKKQKFRLTDGCCLDNPKISVKNYVVKIDDKNNVQIRVD